ncbi:MAG: hypothetical protein LBC20_03230 [Planctomycetaceae bacterium]|jgi:hypothetical protein|nr:hypothetical protein [Planctomycetaceae bacterium]
MRIFNQFCFLFFVLLSLTFTVLVIAQEVSPSSAETVSPEIPPELVSEPPRSPVIQPLLPRMNPMVLLRMKQQLTFELQQTQRTLGFIDPNDKQLTASLQEQQTELVNQLKEINSQLKTQGIPIDNSAMESEERLVNGLVPKTPNIIPETLPSGTLPPTAPNPVLPRREIPATGMITPKENVPPSSASPLRPALPPTPEMGRNPAGNPINNPIESANHLPTSFDQDQAWADSPWIPKPSKELTELKQTVDSLRKEITDLKENIKALEVQIQLLNRNILLSQPK